MKTQLQQLVEEYKKTNNQKLLNEIVVLLTPIIKDKARYIYNKKWIRIDKKGIRESIDEYNSNIEDKKDNPKYINLKQSGKTTLLDVEQELWLTLLRIIKNYDIKKPFYKYLTSSLWNWTPRSLISEIKNTVKESSLMDYDQSSDEFKIDKKIILTLKEREQEIIKLLQNKTRPIDIAKLLGYSKSYIYDTIKKITKKLRKNYE